MRTLTLTLILGLMPLLLLAQTAEQSQLAQELLMKSWYFTHLETAPVFDPNGTVQLNGAEVDLKHADVGYTSTADNQHFLVLRSTDPLKLFPVRSQHGLVCFTDAVYHPVSEAEQAVELTVLLTFLQAMAAQKAG